MKTLFVFLMVLSGFTALSQQTIYLQPGPEGKDAMVWTIKPDDNFATTPKFASMSWTHSGVPGKDRSYIDFDLSVIPPGRTIVDARLNLYFLCLEPNYFGHTGDNGSWLRLITEPWDESTITWNFQPASTDFDQVYLPPSTDPYMDYTDIDVTALIRHEYEEPETYYGMMLRLITEWPYRCLLFASGDYTDTVEMRPMLQVTYVDCTPPSVSFEYETEGLSASFTGTCPSALTWHWDFGDGDTSNLQNPEHTYLQQGIYEVCLTVWDTCYFTKTCQTIEVCTGPPAVAFSYVQEDMIILLDNQTPDAQYFHWDFGDGDTSNLANPSHAYDELGVYQVCLTAWNSCGTDSVCQLIDVCLLPETYLNYWYDYGLQVQFWEGAYQAKTFFWDFGDGTSSEFSNPLHVYADEGSYYVCLTTFNDCGSNQLCDWIYVGYEGIPLAKQYRFNVYPNPTDGSINITSDYEGRAQVSLVSLQGQEIIKREVILSASEAATMNLGAYPPGLYLLRIEGGGIHSVRKIVVN
jgi:PKD repeat protein